MSFFSKLFGKKSDNSAAPSADVTPAQTFTEPPATPAVPSQPAPTPLEQSAPPVPEQNETPDQIPPAPSA